MSFNETLREVRRLYSIYDVLGLDSHISKIVCPLPMHIHHMNSPSFHIFTNAHGVELFQCFGTCGKRGDVIDLIGYMNFPNYDQHNPQDITRAVALLGQKVTWREPKPIERPVVLLPDAWREYVPPGPRAVAYAHKRGLSDETIALYRLGQYENFLAIPYFEEGLLQGIKFRNTGPGLRFMSAKGSKAGLFNYDTVAYKEAPLLFLKGEIPTMLLSMLGFKACGLTTGEGSYIERWVPVLSFSERIVVVGDNDPDPDTREKMQDKAKEHADLLHGILRFPPGRYKDIDEFYLAEPQVAIPMVQGWLRGE